MNRKKRRPLLAWLMILAMLCTMFPTAALATEGPSDGAAGPEVTVAGATYSVVAQLENFTFAKHSITKEPVPDGIWSVALDKTEASEGETVTVTVSDTAFSSWATGLIVTGDSGAEYDFTTITAATGNANNVNGAGVYSFVMPDESVTVGFTADYTPLDVYIRYGAAGEDIPVHSYTRAEMEALAAENATPIHYAMYDRKPAVFMGKAVRYVTIAQLAASASGYNSDVRFDGPDCSLRGASLDGWTLGASGLSWEYLMGQPRKYYAGIGDQYLDSANRTGEDRVVPAVLAITGWAGRETEVDNQPYDTLNTYRFFYGQTEAEYGNGVLPTMAERDARCTAMNTSKYVNKVVFVVPESTPATYTVTADSAITGGSLALSPAGGSAGDTITVTVTPADGKEFVAGSLKYTTDNGASYTEITDADGVYSFTLPAADTVVTARFMDPGVAVNGVSLDKSTLTLTAGNFEQLTATVTPVDAANQEVAWTSDNTAVATAGSDGLVRAMGAGTANITVTTVDGDFTAACAVTVQPANTDHFTIAVLPDTQFYSESYPEIFAQQTQWVVNRADLENIVFVAHLGDIQDDFDNPVQWQNAKDAMATIRAAGIPYALVPGNHDLNFDTGDTTMFDSYFPCTDFTGYSWYGGNYPADSNASSYQLFSAMGQDFIVLNLVCTPALLADATDWANGVLTQYSGRKAIVVTHGYIKPNGEYSGGDDISGIAIRNNIVKKHGNVIAVLCGHNNGQYHGTDTGESGNTIYNLLTNYTDQPNGGNGWLRLYQFYPLSNTLQAVTYSPYLEQYDTSAAGQFQLPLAERFTVTVDSSISGGAVTVNPASGSEGDTITVTVTPDEGKQLVAGSLKYTADNGASYTEITATEGVYSFVLPAVNVTVTAQFEDISGAGTEDNPYRIKTAADLAALAEYTNSGNPTRGVYWALENDIDLSSVCSEALGSWTPIGNKQISAADVVTGYAFLGDFNGNGHSIQNLYVSSLSGYLGLFGAIGGNDNHDGTDGYGVVRNFKLYGSVTNTLDSLDENSFPDYVGAVCGKLYGGGAISDVVNYATVAASCVYNVGGIAGFAGTSVKNGANESYARYTNDPSGNNTSILRCVNNGAVTGYTKVGGIAGQNASKIMYCYNTGRIDGPNNSSKNGIGGIAGRNGNNNTAYEEGTIAYCYNTGTVGRTGQKWVGGIVGFQNSKSTVFNCYATGTIIQGAGYNNPIVGQLEGPSINNYSLDTLYATGTHVSETGIRLSESALKDQTYTDTSILTLLGHAFAADTGNINDGYPVLRWQKGGSEATITSISIISEPTKTIYYEPEIFNPTGMKIKVSYSDGSYEIVSAGFTYATTPLTADITSITVGYVGQTVTQPITVHDLTSIVVTKAPNKTAYNASEVFSKSGMVVTAYYSDGTSKAISNYTYLPTDGLTTDITEITISYYDRTTTQPVTVNDLVLTGIAITTAPAKTFYLGGDSFDKTGMVVKATYNDAVVQELTAEDCIVTPDPLTTGLAEVTVSYTYLGVTKTATTPVTVLTALPALDNGYYQLSNADELRWFADQVSIQGHTTANAKLVNDITLTSDWVQPIGSAANKFAGTFDGNGKSINGLNNNAISRQHFGLFGYIDQTTIKDISVTVNLAGAPDLWAGLIGYGENSTIENATVSGSLTSTNPTIAGIASYAVDCTFVNCVNNASVSARGTVGGIVGRAAGSTSLTGCVNNGTITASQDTVGGIAGTFLHNTGSITSCINNGEITGSHYVGGIVGSSPATILKCTNTGQVKATSASGTNTGYTLGGIVGSFSSSAIDQCYNSGEVTGSIASIGGIAGNMTGADAAIKNSYNLGDVASTRDFSNVRVGGVVGYKNNGNAIVQNCYSAGTISVSGTASNNYAGVIGYAQNGVTNVANNYYLNTAADKAIGFDTTYTEANAASKTAAELKALATTLGASYKDGVVYPILTWQTPASPETYTVTVDGAITGGSVGVNPASGSEGDTITVTVTPAEGKQLVAGSLKYNDGAADIEIAATAGVYSFVLPAADVTVTARFEDISTDPRYMVIPVTDESVYTVGETGGIKTMIVKAGVGGLKYFGAQLTPVIAHAGKEAVVFTHLRDGAQLSLNITKADFDLVGQAQAGFNVQAGDTVKVYIVDDLTNDVGSNPTLLQ